MDLDERQQRALEIHDLYDELNRRERRVWRRDEFMLGFMGDVGDLTKLITAEEAAGGRSALGNELADCLWSVLVLAHLYNVNLAGAFRLTMTELEESISAQLADTGGQA
ncbi:nucleotide pyrophosphohydrolase [Streptomyces sp. NPDC021100]|uniref:nucleotide pyrophosphohydrolase n=1 Tax=Streptomyces sp. NPDC021100 TaxID=3365114 RepID=UPI0037B6931A